MTNSHSLSVITNSCVKSTPNSVKNPLDCDDYHYNSLAMCNHGDYSNGICENGNGISSKSPFFTKTKAVRFATNADMDSDLQELEGLQGELFLEKLNELKESHRINMELSEHRYLNSVNNLRESFNEYKLQPSNDYATVDTRKSRDAMRDSHMVIRENSPARNSYDVNCGVIADMWSNFSIEERMKNKQPSRHRSNPDLTQKINQTPKKAEQNIDNWKNRITVAKPFNMDHRYKTPAKTRTMIEYEKELDSKMENELSECKQNFKAQPVPDHVFQNLYDENTGQSRATTSRTPKKPPTCQQPFGFNARDSYTKKCLDNHRHDDADNMDVEQFIAKPFPEHIFGQNVKERIKEQDIYRKIRMEIRSLKLLKDSSLPPNMENRKLKNKMNKKDSKIVKNQSLYSEDSFSPEIHEKVPDFDRMHRRLAQEMRGCPRGGSTVCKPFTFKLATRCQREPSMSTTASSTRSSHHHHHQHQTRASTCKHLGGSFTSLDSVPTKMTNAALLRASTTKSRSMNRMQKQEMRDQQELLRSKSDAKLRRLIEGKVSYKKMDENKQRQSETKIRAHRIAERERDAEYKRELLEMKSRVNSRPLLFEQVAQSNAKMAVEKKYRDTLEENGVYMHQD